MTPLRPVRSLGLLLLLGFLVAGCKEGITSHNITLKGVEHGKKLYHGAKNCTACHGIALQGNGWIPSCYNCHNVLWNKDSHQSNRGGVMHLSGQPARLVCAECHGGKLEGSLSRPSCTKCHADNWTEYENSHSFSRNGVKHGTKLYQPAANCASCHGSDLKGQNNRPSCYSCHGAKWEQFSTTHTLDKGGKLHQTNLFTPSGRCTICHGSDLKGSEVAPSCYSCHDNKWGSFSDIHTKARGGYQHGTKMYAPTSNCASCHGSDLRGSGNQPSCYKCHDSLCTKSTHGRSRHGAAHASGSPAEYCINCHGTDFRGGTPPEAPTRTANSCYQCHNGPYAGD